MLNTARSRTTIAAFAAVVALGLAACGEDDPVGDPMEEDPLQDAEDGDDPAADDGDEGDGGGY